MRQQLLSQAILMNTLHLTKMVSVQKLLSLLMKTLKLMLQRQQIQVQKLKLQFRMTLTRKWQQIPISQAVIRQLNKNQIQILKPLKVNPQAMRLPTQRPNKVLMMFNQVIPHRMIKLLQKILLTIQMQHLKRYLQVMPLQNKKAHLLSKLKQNLSLQVN